MQKILYALSLAMMLGGAFLFWQESNAVSPEGVLALAAARRTATNPVSIPVVAEADNRWIPFLEALSISREIDNEHPEEGSLLYRVFEVEGFANESNPELSVEDSVALLSDPRVASALSALEAGAALPEASLTQAWGAAGLAVDEEVLYGASFLRFLVSVASAEHARKANPERVVDLIEALSTLSKDLVDHSSSLAFHMGVTLTGIPELRFNYWNDIHDLNADDLRVRVDSVLQSWEEGYLDHQSILTWGLEDYYTYLEKSLQAEDPHAREYARAYLDVQGGEELLRSLFALRPGDTVDALKEMGAPKIGLEGLCSRLHSDLRARRVVLVNLRLARFTNAHLMNEEQRISIPSNFLGGHFETVEESSGTLVRYRNAEGDIERELGSRP